MAFPPSSGTVAPSQLVASGHSTDEATTTQGTVFDQKIGQIRILAEGPGAEFVQSIAWLCIHSIDFTVEQKAEILAAQECEVIRTVAMVVYEWELIPYHGIMQDALVVTLIALINQITVGFSQWRQSWQSRAEVYGLSAEEACKVLTVEAEDALATSKVEWIESVLFVFGNVSWLWGLPNSHNYWRHDGDKGKGKAPELSHLGSPSFRTTTKSQVWSEVSYAPLRNKNVDHSGSLLQPSSPVPQVALTAGSGRPNKSLPYTASASEHPFTGTAPLRYGADASPSCHELILSNVPRRFDAESASGSGWFGTPTGNRDEGSTQSHPPALSAAAGTSSTETPASSHPNMPSDIDHFDISDIIRGYTPVVDVGMSDHNTPPKAGPDFEQHSVDRSSHRSSFAAVEDVMEHPLMKKATNAKLEALRNLQLEEDSHVDILLQLARVIQQWKVFGLELLVSSEVRGGPMEDEIGQGIGIVSDAQNDAAYLAVSKLEEKEKKNRGDMDI